MRTRTLSNFETTAPAQQFDALAATWDREHGPESARASEFAARIQYLRTLCRDLGRPGVLDLGCATGQMLLHLADVIAAGLGIDIAPAMIARAQQNAAASSLRFRVADAADFCAGCSERFDLVLLVGLLEHLPDQAAALAGAKRVLAAEGRLVVIMPHPWGPAFQLKRLLDNGRFTPRLRMIAARHGLELVAVRAMAYAPWPRLSFGPRVGVPRAIGRHNPLAGVMHGAFAAEFEHHWLHRRLPDRAEPNWTSSNPRDAHSGRRSHGCPS